MKVRASVKKMCNKCKVIRRKGVVRVLWKTPSTNNVKVRRSLLTFKGICPQD